MYQYQNTEQYFAARGWQRLFAATCLPWMSEGAQRRRHSGAQRRHARYGAAGKPAGHCPGGRRRQQYPGGPMQRGRHRGVQHPGRQRQCGEGTGAGRAGAGQPQGRSRAWSGPKRWPARATPCGKLVEKGKSQFAGPELAGKTLGVVGLGAIGVQGRQHGHPSGHGGAGAMTRTSLWRLPGAFRAACATASIVADLYRPV